MTTMLVVPTNRPGSLGDFLNAWEGLGGWDTVCVVEDAPRKSDEVAAAVRRHCANENCANWKHFSHEEVDAVLGEDSWIISRRDSAIRCFGFLIAHRLGVDVLTLDDDCFPVDACDNLAEWHRGAMEHPRWTESVPGMRTRGLPYRNRGVVSAVANVGLWTGVPDLDGPQSLLAPVTNFTPPSGSRIVPAGQYVPVCGMNLYIRHKALPLFFFPMMGEGRDGSSWPYRRFDDIAAGVIAKRCMDHLGWHLSVGEPWVEHRKASDPFVNLVKEAPGIAWNERFWELVHGIDLRDYISAPHCIQRMGEALVKDGEEYHRDLGNALVKWANLFSDGGLKL